MSVINVTGAFNLEVPTNVLSDFTVSGDTLFCTRPTLNSSGLALVDQVIDVTGRTQEVAGTKIFTTRPMISGVGVQPVGPSGVMTSGDVDFILQGSGYLNRFVDYSDVLGELNIHSGVTIADTLDVGGDTYISGALDVTGDLNVTGKVSIGNALTVNGLTVTGEKTALRTTNLCVTDPLIIIAQDQPSPAAYDAGLLIHRDLDGGLVPNVGWVYDESDDSFTFFKTFDSGNVAGNLTYESFAPIRAGAGYFTGVVGLNTISPLSSLGVVGGVDADVYRSNDITIYESGSFVGNQTFEDLTVEGDLTIEGDLILTNLPSSPPAQPNKVWRNGSQLMIT